MSDQKLKSKRKISDPRSTRLYQDQEDRINQMHKAMIKDQKSTEKTFVNIDALRKAVDDGLEVNGFPLEFHRKEVAND